MLISKQFRVDAQIRNEVYKALEYFGASPEDISIVEGDDHPQHEIYETFRGLGAKPDVLSIISSWGDTMDDACVLDALREWNRRVRPISRRRPN